MLLLAGMSDDYVHDGRALVEDLAASALPSTLQQGPALPLFELLAQVYKQINAPVGPLGMQSLAASTQGLAGDDKTYASIESNIAALTTKRDEVAASIIAILEGAEFQGQAVVPSQVGPLLGQAHVVLAKGNQLTH
jgi:hypothetical protein